MKREEIIQMAREAGYEPKIGWELAFDLWDFDFERFADIVAVAEREACAKLCEDGIDYEHPIVKGHIMKNFEKSKLLAQAIRARGEK